MARNLGLFVVCALILAPGQAAFAQDEDASFAGRIFALSRTEAQASNDLPDNLSTSGYVRLEIDATSANDAAYCRKTHIWRNVSDQIARIGDRLFNRDYSSGTAVRFWVGAITPSSGATTAATQPPAGDINVLTVIRAGQCRVQDAAGPFLSPLARADSAGFTVQLRRWFVSKNNQAQLDRVRSAGRWVGTAAGLPAPVTAVFAAGAVRVLDVATTDDSESSSLRSFNPRVSLHVTPAITGPAPPAPARMGRNSVLRTYIGYNPESTTFSGTGSATQAHIDIRLRAIASLWDQTRETYTGLDLSTKVVGGLVTEPIENANGRTLEDIFAKDPTLGTFYAQMKTAPNAELFQGPCSQMEARLRQNMGFSDVDAAVAVYAVGYAHPYIGENASTAMQRSYLQAPCIAVKQTELAKAGIKIVVTAPTAAPTVTQVVNQIDSSIGPLVRSQTAQEWGSTGAAAFTSRVNVTDLVGDLRLPESQRSSAERGPLAEALAKTYETYGCRLPTAVTAPAGGIAWPGGTPAGTETGTVLLGKNGAGNAAIAYLLFDSVKAGETPRIRGMLITSELTRFVDQIRVAYPDGCAGWKPANVFPAPPPPPPPPPPVVSLIVPPVPPSPPSGGGSAAQPGAAGQAPTAPGGNASNAPQQSADPREA